MYRITGQAINLRYIATSIKQDIQLSEQSLHIIKVAEFGIKHGYAVAIEAFNVSKSTYYHYRKLYLHYKEHGVVPILQSKKPDNVRKASWNKKVVRFIIKFRKSCPNIGKSKIKYYLDKYCEKNNIASISTGTIQDIINSFKNKLRTKKSIKEVKHKTGVIRKPAQYKALQSGECVALDSMEFRQSGKKLYVVTVIDEATGLLFARGTNSHTSQEAKLILDKAYDYLPWDNFNTILTDNGSEFSKDFAKHLRDNNITHYHTYPKTPKQNARCERVNRTIQDEFMIKYGNLLFSNITLFNKKLIQYLHWYNMKRVHQRFNNKLTPFEYHLELTKNVKIVA